MLCEHPLNPAVINHIMDWQHTLGKECDYQAIVSLSSCTDAHTAHSASSGASTTC